MMIYVTNALPGALLLAGQMEGLVAIQPLSAAEAADILTTADWTSAVGHADTARLFSAVLGIEVAENRISLPQDTLRDGHFLLAGLYSGPRLPEGAMTLPEGASIAWALVSRPGLGLVEEGQHPVAPPVSGQKPGHTYHYEGPRLRS